MAEAPAPDGPDDQPAPLRRLDHVPAPAPHDVDALCRRGHDLRKQQRYQDACVSYEAALHIEPGRLDALYHRAEVLLALGWLEEAVAAFDRALEVKPDLFPALYNRATALLNLRRPAQALAGFDIALRLQPDDARALNNRGLALHNLRRLPEALDSLDRAVAVAPDHADAHSNRGNVLQALGRLPEALASYDRALALAPDNADALCNRGAVLQAMERFPEALASCDRALAIAPGHAEAWNNRGSTLLESLDPRAALSCFEQAKRIAPGYGEAHLNAGICRLMLGDLAAGWSEFEWRWQSPALRTVSPPNDAPRWFGQAPLQGRSILLWSEQGLGDTIQFCRLARLVAARGAEVVLCVQPSLRGLLAAVEGVALVVSTGCDVPITDYQCPLLSLPLALGITADTIPASRSYLRPDAARVGAWDAKLGERRTPRIGLAWSGNPQHSNDRHRSIPLRQFLRVATGPFEFACCQAEIRDADQPFLTQHPDLRCFSGALTDLRETAALLAHMDLVITVDTAVAHLAGAMGRPVWILLPHVPDWRWLLERADSPWYPTARLFRQAQRGDWAGVLKQVAAALDGTERAVAG